MNTSNFVRDVAVWQAEFPHIAALHWHKLDAKTIDMFACVQKIWGAPNQNNQTKHSIAQTTVIVEQPWQASVLREQAKAAAKLAGRAQALPKIITLSSWINAWQANQPDFVSISPTARTLLVAQALAALPSTLFAAGRGMSPTARLTLAHTFIALYEEMQRTSDKTLAQVLDKLQHNHWLSTEAKVFSLIAAELDHHPSPIAQNRAAIVALMHEPSVLCLIPAAHPQSLMRLLLAQADLPTVIVETQLDLSESQSQLGQFSPLNVLVAPHFEREAQHALQWVVAQLEADAPEIALVAHDRKLARRVQALLARLNIAVDDRVGWALSTTHAAVAPMRLLQALCQPAPHEAILAVMQWLDLPEVKSNIAGAAALHALLRRRWQKTDIVPHTEAQFSAWWQAAAMHAKDDLALNALMQQVWHWRSLAHKPDAQRTPAAWAAWLQSVLAAVKFALCEDAAGVEVWRVLDAMVADTCPLTVRMNEFKWLLNAAFEAARYAPAAVGARVQFLPMYEAAWTAPAAVLMLGCTDANLPARQDAAAIAQPLLRVLRQELGLPSAAREFENFALLCARKLSAHKDTSQFTCTYSAQIEGIAQTPSVFLSPFVAQAIPSVLREVKPQAVLLDLNREHTEIQGTGLQFTLPERLSVSVVGKLLQCPYQFMLSALRIREVPAPALWPTAQHTGNILHAVLEKFHLQFPTITLQIDVAARLQRADLIHQLQAIMLAEIATHAPASGRFWALGSLLSECAAAYIDAQIERWDAGWQVSQVEASIASADILPKHIIHGKFDRLDHNSGANSAEVIDYKTSSETSLKARVADPMLDPQLLLYALLLNTQAAAYWSIKKGNVSPMPVDAVGLHKMAVLDAIQAAHVAVLDKGATATPSKKTCQYCAFKGVCRVSV